MGSGDSGDAPGSAAGQAREMKQSLQRTRKMMAEQLARVAQVSEVMGEQDALLMNTFAEHQASAGPPTQVISLFLRFVVTAFRLLLRSTVLM